MTCLDSFCLVSLVVNVLGRFSSCISRFFIDSYFVFFNSVVYCSTAEEETRAKLLLPVDTGNELGETVVDERKIRIGMTPVATAAIYESDVLPSQFYECMSDSVLRVFPFVFCLSRFCFYYPMLSCLFMTHFFS